MTGAEELRRQMDVIRSRIRLYEGQLAQAPTASERETLRGKLSGLRAAMRDLKLQLDHLEPPARKRQRQAHRRLNVDNVAYDWFERSGAVWSDLDGSRQTPAQEGKPVYIGRVDPMREWLAEGAMRLTERQALYINRYYNDGLSLEAIAEEYGTSKSTVSRVIKNGLARMREWVEAKRLIASCADGQGGFDWERYLGQVPVLTDRQRELMLLVLSRLPRTQGELAEKLELERSTVSRTLNRAGETVHRLAVPPAPPTSTPTIEDWEQAGKWELALQTGMGLGFCYRFCSRGERHEGLTRYNYELLRRLRDGQSPEQTAQELGMKVKTVRSAYGRVRRWARAGP